MSQSQSHQHLAQKAYVITGPTSGIGLLTAYELAKHGQVILVGRDRRKLADLQTAIEQKGQQAVWVQCDLSDMLSVKRAVAEILALNLPIAGVLNNAGMRQTQPTKSAQGWDMTFATNHLGPFALTEGLVPYLADGTQIVFIASAVENPERQPAKRVGFRGGRYLSAAASARGEWQPGGSTLPGGDAYATSKQAILAAALAFARETPRLRFNAIEPGVIPATGLSREEGPMVQIMAKTLVPILVPLLMPFLKFLSTPERASKMITQVLINRSGQTGVYFDEGGQPMRGSDLVHDPKFQDRVLAETRELLASV